MSATAGNAEDKLTSETRLSPLHVPVRTAAGISAGILYWWLFAYSNSMVVYYQNSIYPLLAATGTPNPFFFLRTWSALALYNSGMQWAVTGHIVFMFLLGNVFFSLVLGFMAANCVILFLRSVSRSTVLDEKSRLAVIGFSSVMLLMLLMPLLAIPLFFLPTDQVTHPAQVLLTNYAPELNLLDAAVLWILITFWHRFIEAAADGRIEGGLAGH